MSICYPYVIPATAAAYAGGPGDVVSGAMGWWGLRAYSLAKVATAPYAGIRIVKTSDGSAAQDINILATGALDVATIAGLGYGVSVTKIYDQSGGVAHLEQATLANMPVLTLSGIGSLPVITFTGASSHRLQTQAGAHMTGIAQPFTYSTVAKSINTALQQVIMNFATSIYFGFNLSGTNNNTAFSYAGAGLNGAATDGSFHALHGIFNSVAGVSDMNVDGTATTGSVSGSGMTPANIFTVGADDGLTSKFNGPACEFGVWPIAFTGGNSSAMSTNQHAYWGF